MTTPSSTRMLNGPLIKNACTNTFEMIVRIGLAVPDKISFTIDNGIKVMINNQIALDFSHILSKTNLTHVKFNNQESDQFMAKFADPVFYHVAAENNASLSYLNSAEKYAITEYTGSLYKKVNSLLYKHQTFTETDVKNLLWSHENLSGKLFGLIAKTGFIASGLNKIDKTPEIIKTYRGHSQFSDQDLQKIMKEVDTHGESLLDINAFLSTSEAKNVANAFSYKTIIHFEDDYGKSIEPLSYIKDEQEYLVIPGEKMLITGYEILPYGKTQLNAKIINPLDNKFEHSTQAEWENLLDVVNWAKAHDIPTDKLDLFTQVKLETLSHDDIFHDTPNNQYKAIDFSLETLSMPLGDIFEYDTVLTPAALISTNLPEVLSDFHHDVTMLI